MEFEYRIQKRLSPEQFNALYESRREEIEETVPDGALHGNDPSKSRSDNVKETLRSSWTAIAMENAGGLPDLPGIVQEQREKGWPKFVVCTYQQGNLNELLVANLIKVGGENADTAVIVSALYKKNDERKWLNDWWTQVESKPLRGHTLDLAIAELGCVRWTATYYGKSFEAALVDRNEFPTDENERLPENQEIRNTPIEVKSKYGWD